MIKIGLSTSEAAARLGVKPATLYSYVSRGLLHPQRGPAGSTYDVEEVLLLSRSARRPSGRSSTRRAGRDPAMADPVFVTELTLIEDGRLYYRGLDAVVLAGDHRFEEIAMWLWCGRWPPPRPAWSAADGPAAAASRAMSSLPAGVDPVERFAPALVAAALGDELRHDLSPGGVVVTGQTILSLMVDALDGPGKPRPGPDPGRAGGPSWVGPAVASGGLPPAGATVGPGRPERLSARLWWALTGRAPTRGGLRALEAALVLGADHELAPSTLAARVAASFRADPYTVVVTGLGPATGTWQSGSTGAPGQVERLLRAAERDGPERAIGDTLKARGEIPHGFGMPLYPRGDPRAAALLSHLDGVGSPRRVDLVRRVVALGATRGFAPPNFDLALAALTYCAGMVPGAAQAIFTLSKAAGWLAHAIEEYDRPTRFRMRGDYVGPRPETLSRS